MAQRKERTRTYVLYDSNERVFSPYDRSDDGLIGGPPTPRESKPQKRLVEDKVRELAPYDKFPVGITFDNILDYSSDDGREGGSEQKHVYAVPLFSYQVVQQLEGRLLDYIDATYAEKEQREAQKRVLRKILWGYHGELCESRKSAYEHSELFREDSEN